MEFLWLGDCLREVILTEEEDQPIWPFNASGVYCQNLRITPSSMDQ
jgi:hypothetical protein